MPIAWKDFKPSLTVLRHCNGNVSKLDKQTVLALYPTRYGMGYAVFDGPEDLVDYGISYVQPMSNKKMMKKVKEYISFFNPAIVLCRNVNDLKKRAGKRTKKLIDLICGEAKSQDLQVHSYTRSDIQNVFSQFGATTKYQIQKKIIEWYPVLKAYEFPKRGKWKSENHNTGVFDAVSLAIVYWYMAD